MSATIQHSTSTAQGQNSLVSQPDQLSQARPPTSIDEVKMFWYVRWFLLICFTIGYLACLTTGIVGFSLTQNVHFLFFLSPTPIVPFLISLVPLDEKRYHLKLRKIEIKAEIKAKRRQMSSKKQESP